MTMNKNTRIDETLKILLICILIYGILCQCIGIFFVDSILKFSVGLWIGILLAAAGAWHMWWSLNRNLTINADNEGGAKAYSIKQSMIRYVVVCIVFVAVCLTGFAYPLATFLGVLGLKIGAYMHPVINRLLKSKTT